MEKEEEEDKGSTDVDLVSGPTIATPQSFRTSPLRTSMGPTDLGDTSNGSGGCEATAPPRDAEEEEKR